MAIDFNVIEAELQQEADEQLTTNLKHEYKLLKDELKRLSKDADNCDKDYAKCIALAEAKLDKLKAIKDADDYAEWRRKVRNANDVSAWDTTVADAEA